MLAQIIEISTCGKTLHNITAPIEKLVQNSGISIGICALFLRHSSASLIIQENADPDVLKDLETFFSKLVPESNQAYRHIAEGDDDMPAHIRTALTKTSETIPIMDNKMVLGIWQGIYVWEHRRCGRHREVVVHIWGS